MTFILWFFYGTIVLYSIIDAVQTKMLIDLGAMEANPILRWAIAETNTIYVIFIIKALWLIFLLVLLIVKTRSERNSLVSQQVMTTNLKIKDI